MPTIRGYILKTAQDLKSRSTCDVTLGVRQAECVYPAKQKVNATEGNVRGTKHFLAVGHIFFLLCSDVCLFGQVVDVRKKRVFNGDCVKKFLRRSVIIVASAYPEIISYVVGCKVNRRLRLESISRWKILVKS